MNSHFLELCNYWTYDDKRKKSILAGERGEEGSQREGGVFLI